MIRLGKARKAALLAQMPLFSTCSRHQLGMVTELVVHDQLAAGTVLTREDASGGVAYLLVSGQAEVRRGGRRLAVLGPGDIVGELSLIDGRPRSATVTAVSDVEVLEIDGRDLRRLLRRVPAVTRKLLEAMAGRVRQADTLPRAGL